MSSSRHDLQIIKRKIETGEHYFTKEELDAIWWDGYEHGSLDSAYDMYDKGYAAAAIDGYLLLPSHYLFVVILAAVLVLLELFVVAAVLLLLLLPQALLLWHWYQQQ
jgi:hypothetical protein